MSIEVSSAVNSMPQALTDKERKSHEPLKSGSSSRLPQSSKPISSNALKGALLVNRIDF